MEELPQSIYAVAQDDLGFLWFGTEEGLVRYDGARTEFWRKRAGGLRHNFIDDLLVDGQQLWISTNGGGLHLFDLRAGTFRYFLPSLEERGSPKSGQLGALFLDSRRRLWVSSQEEGTYRCDLSKGPELHFIQLPLPSKDRSPNTVSSFFEESSGKMLATGPSGILTFSEENGRWYPLAEIEPSFAQLTQVTKLLGKQGVPRYALSLRHGLAKLTWGERPSWEAVAELPFPLAHGFLDSVDRLWLASKGVLVYREGDPLIHYQHDRNNSYSLPFDHLLRLFELQGGGVLASTFGGGVLVMDPQMEKMFRLDANLGLPDCGIRAFAQQEDGGIWVGSFGSGLLFFKDLQAMVQKKPQFETQLFGDRSDSPANHVWCLLAEGNRLWAGTDRGLFLGTGAGFSRVPMAVPKERSAGNLQQVRSLARAEHVLWVGTDGGLLGLPAEGGEAVLVNRGSHPLMKSSRVYSLLVEDERNVLLGTWSGLHRYSTSDDQIRQLPLGDGEQPFVWNLQRGKGSLLVSTSDGLFLLSPQGTILQHFRDSLPSPTIYSSHWVAPHLWGSSNRGLFRLDPGTGKVDHFGTLEGAQGTEFHYSSSLHLAEGWLLFGGSKGLNVLKPDKVTLSSFASKTMLTGIDLLDAPLFSIAAHRTMAQIDGEIPYARALVLTHKARSITFHFAGSDFMQFKNQHFIHQLEGFDSDWRTTSHRFASYTNLPAGSYEFRVRALNRDGQASPLEASLRVEIKPPFWRRGDVRLIFALALALAARAAYRWRLSSVVKQQVRIERTIWERTEEIRRENADLYHNSITDALTGVANRRHLLAQGSRMLASAKRTGAPLSLILMDIDHFKKVNDNHGHQVGDDCLVHVARSIAELVREEDVFGRYGGEEFLLLLPHSDGLATAMTAERIRQTISSSPIRSQGKTLSVTLSLGYAVSGMDSIEEMLQRADENLYRAKNKGRNRVEPEWTPTPLVGQQASGS
jgi:diguanylate cyclase (GGDEF)-like protein